MTIRIDHPTLQLGDRRLQVHTRFECLPGQIICLTGESGCGKTSLLRAILGFTNVESGLIEADGKRLTPDTVRDLRRRTAYVPQELLPCVEWVKEAVMLPFSLKVNAGIRFDKHEMLALWDEMGLERNVWELRTGELSGGQRARMVLATALLTHKELLLIDEPTAALDADSSERVGRLLHCWTEKEQTTTIVVTHDKALMATTTTITV